MKLPINLDIEEDTIWTEYKKQLLAIRTVDELISFVDSWREVYSIEILKPNQQILDDIKAEKSSDIVAELIIPIKILKAMMCAKEFVVPLNCAFIQQNGGFNVID